jgi:hypothetical protein
MASDMRVKRPIMLSWVMLSAGMSGLSVRDKDPLV